MRLFDLATWTAIVILVLGSSAIFIWFLKDAGKVLRGHEVDRDAPPDGEERPGGPDGKDSPAGGETPDGMKYG